MQSRATRRMRRQNEKAIKMGCISVKGMHRFFCCMKIKSRISASNAQIAPPTVILRQTCSVIPRDDVRNDSNPLGTARDCRRFRFCRNNP